VPCTWKTLLTVNNRSCFKITGIWIGVASFFSYVSGFSGYYAFNSISLHLYSFATLASFINMAIKKTYLNANNTGDKLTLF